jgi:glycosyltransferase involved in cell wall biosynthesis
VPASFEKIIVVNNAEESAPVAIDETRFRVLRFARSLGYSRAINEGAAAARGRYLVFCDADTYGTRGWLKALARTHLCAPGAGVTSAKLLDPATSRVIDFGIAFTEYNMPHPFMDRPSRSSMVRRDRQVQAACSAVMMIERKLFLDMSGFDERLYNYYNDIDLCLRLKDRGLSCWVSADAVAYHKGSSTTLRRDGYKADVKAWFHSRNEHRMTVDMDRYFGEGFDAFRTRESPAADGYILIDLTSIVDRSWHHELIRSHIPVRDVYEFPPQPRDSERLSLIDMLGPHLLKLRLPLAYFVDRFVGLAWNSLWYRLRADQRDVVVDRNGNVLPFRAVVRKQLKAWEG